MTLAERRLWSVGLPLALGILLLLATQWAGLAVTAGLVVVAIFAARARSWALAACAAVWSAAMLAVQTLPGPYDSWAGKAVLPVLAGYVSVFLAAWAIGRQVISWRTDRINLPMPRPRPQLRWPTDRRLLTYLLVLLGIASVTAAIRFRGVVPPLFADNPDVARQALRLQSSIVIGLLSEAWTLGMGVSLLRAVSGNRSRSLIFYVLAGVFTVGAALGASKNSVLVGIAPALIAALSARHSRPRASKSFKKIPVILLIAAVVLGTAVFLGGQRTMAGTGSFETEFRSRYGNSALASSAASLDLSLSSSTETFGRLWSQRENFEPTYGAYSLTFLGSHAQPLFGQVDLYGLTSQLSQPYFMNTATFVAIPLLDYGPIGVLFFLAALGLAIGSTERWFEFSASPAAQLGRGFIVYFALFGVYELYPLIYPTWLSLVPGLWVLHWLGRTAK
ncbi:O-antigen polymerase [Micromonospora sp. DT201]|uniref:O-antigen polymerase n=1 Tax=Micromonospora sp. DT201 TaxID=3393442 RepID=UPI003CEB8847